MSINTSDLSNVVMKVHIIQLTALSMFEFKCFNDSVYDTSMLCVQLVTNQLN